jgi:hypothetical protein
VHAANSSLDVAEIIRGARLIEELHASTADWGRLHRWLAESCLRSGHRGAALRQFASAAVRGQMGAVGSDLLAIARRRVKGLVGSTETVSASSVDTWIAEASAWLSVVESCGP